METKPHGWATTRAGSMFHYFGMTREGGEGYRTDGSPLAMCHNALEAGHELAAKLEPGAKQCASCARYLANSPKTAKVLATVGDEPLKKGQFRTVLRGQFKGLTVEVWEESKDFPGFWMCWYTKGTGAKTHQAELMLSAGQLGAAQ
jgi:hypothetical protein